MKEKIEIIIPAYNEEHRIVPTLLSYLSFFPDTVSFFVVLNGCWDNTESVVKNLCKKFPHRLRYIVIKEAIGKGGALLHGFQDSQADYIGFVDADGSTSPEEYQKLITALPQYDGVIASRFIKGAIVQERQSFLRTIMSHLFLRYARVMLGLPYTDMQCGAKIFHSKALRDVLPHITQTGMTFDIELLAHLHKKKMHIYEQPTLWIDKKGSHSLGKSSLFLKTGFSMLKNVYQIRKSLFTK